MKCRTSGYIEQHLIASIFSRAMRIHNASSIKASRAAADMAHPPRHATTKMYKVFATNLSDSGADIQSRHRTLEKALQHLYELIQSEVDDPAGPMFDRYGLFREESETALAWLYQDCPPPQQKTPEPIKRAAANQWSAKARAR